MALFNLYLGNFGVFKSPPQQMFTIKHFSLQIHWIGRQCAVNYSDLRACDYLKVKVDCLKTAIEGLEASIVGEVAIRQQSVHMLVQDQIGDHIETIKFWIRYDFVGISCYIQSNWLYNTTIASVYFWKNLYIILPYYKYLDVKANAQKVILKSIRNIKIENSNYKLK